MKIGRDAFLYLDGKDSKFAQCGTCVFGRERCAIMGGVKVSAGKGSCGLYIRDEYTGFSSETPIANLTKEQTGYVERQVRCENCKFIKSGIGSWHCKLFHRLNEEMPDLFDLDEKIDRHGCCNAQTPR